MHTFESKFGTTFHHNADLSGEVRIVRSNGDVMKIMGHDLLEFVANFVRGERISQIENASAEQILGVK